MSIPLFDTAAAAQPLHPELEAAFKRVLGRSAYVLGEELSAFEDEFAAYLGVRHVVGGAAAAA